MSKLYLVGVPIGNYDDITLRAINTLKQVDVIVAEDTRKAKRLLDHLQIIPPNLYSHGSHNEHNSAPEISKMLQEGQSVALISDAGMPTISDPGFLLARQATEAGVPVEVIPGVSAVTTAMAISGIAGDKFCFVGFPPRKKGELKSFFSKLADYPETIVLYESPRRIVETLKEGSSILGRGRATCLARELTKTHQEVIRKSLGDILDELQSRKEVLGEITLVIEGAKSSEKIYTKEI